MIKIKVSYEKPTELLLITTALRGLIEEIKYSDKGKYKKAYIFIKQGK